MFDFSDYRFKVFDPANKKVFGKMKGEFKEKIISEFVELKSKIYSSIDVDGTENKKKQRESIKMLLKT